MYRFLFSAFSSLMFIFSSAAFAGESIKIYAASSMTNAINEIITQFSDSTDIKVTPVFGSSSSLARQIERGAPADVYISANQKWMNYLVNKSIIRQTDTTQIAQNRLALIAPGLAPVKVFDLSDKTSWLESLNDSRLAIGQPESVPAGIYAKQSLINLGVWNDIERSLAPVNNVRIALALVERNETSLGIVYQTDALISKKVSVVQLLPGNIHDPIIYPAAKLSDSESADAFYYYLSSTDAKTVFAKYGFQ